MMRKLAVCFLVVALAAAAAAQAGGAGPAAPAPSVPAGPPPVKVGVFYRDLAIAFSNEGQRDFAAMQKKLEPRRAELAGMNREVEELRKQAQAQTNVVSEEARVNLARTIEQKQKLLQRSAEDFNAEVNLQQQEIASRIYGKLLQTIDRYAKVNGYAVVLNNDENNPQNPILWWAGASVDITKAVVDAYNIESGVPAPPPPPPAAPSASRPATGGTTPPAAPARPAGTTPAPKPSGSNPPR